MECNEDGIKEVPAAGRCSLKRKRGVGALGGVQLVFPAAVVVARAPPPATQPDDSPFMSNMDEISYWVHTRRAPCLYNYDNTIKKQVEQARCSTTKPPSIKTKNEEPSPKKRKLKLLKDDSVSTEKPQKIFLKTPQKQKPGLSTSKSESDANSDIDFNIKMPTTKKARNTKSQKRCVTRVPKKNNNIVASTPKITILRRSLRKTPQIFKDGNCNIAYDIINANIVNGQPGLVEGKAESKGNEIPNNQSKVMSEKGSKVLNGQLEDSSVSGFTANYIRSTKIHSSKRPQKLRNQNSSALAKQSKQRVQPDKMIICMNKSMNTGLPGAGTLNCSTDSSQNALKLVTVEHNEQSTHINKSTSLLKFMETKIEDCNSNSKIHKQERKSKVNISFQSRSSAVSRYPRRHKNNIDTLEPSCSTNIDISKDNNAGRKYNARKGAGNVNPKENLEEKVFKARSRRRKGVKLDVEETNPVIQLNSSIEQVSSTPALNVAYPNTKSSLKNSASSRCLRSRTVRDKVGQFYKESSSESSHKKLSDSAWDKSTPKYAKKVTKNQGGTRQSDRSRDLRNKSGFAACFSDSGSDSAPLKQRKFFC